jgi:hypothetical protein
MNMRFNTRSGQVPMRRLVIVASAGLIAFLALMQGVLTLTGHPRCPEATIAPDLLMALIEFSIAAVAYGVFLLGAIRLRRGWETGKAIYFATVAALLLSGGILSAMFISMSSCAV